MKFNLSQKQLAILQEKSKLLNYLSSSFTKTYFSVGDDKFVVFFRGVKGGIKVSFDIEAPQEKRILQVDYSKWLNAISKMGFAETVEITLTERFLKIAIPGSVDTITLGITLFTADSPEAQAVNSFVEDTLVSTKVHSLKLSEELRDAFTIANMMFSSAGNNNAVAIKKHGVMYADRSIILQVLIPEMDSFLKKGTELVEVHKYTAGFILHAYRFGDIFSFSDNYNVLGWSSLDGSTQCVLTSEACDIALPTDEELLMFKPAEGDSSKLEVDNIHLLDALEFFNGFYEASVWKPIKFDIDKEAKARLHYKHPTTEISKQLDCISASEGTFTIGAEALSKLLSSSQDRLQNKQCTVTLSYDEKAPGVACKVGDIYDVVFAKLTGI
jgi:hypothetical protein